MESASIIENLKEQRNQIASYLSNAVVASNILCRVIGKLDEEQYRLLVRYITPIVDDESETTWEEATATSTAHLLRTSLSKKGGHQPPLIV